MLFINITAQRAVEDQLTPTKMKIMDYETVLKLIREKIDARVATTIEMAKNSTEQASDYVKLICGIIDGWHGIAVAFDLSAEKVHMDTMNLKALLPSSSLLLDINVAAHLREKGLLVPDRLKRYF